MPRASRHYLPKHVWHITHRCHKKEFLLKFACDRRRWMYWLYEARRRFRLCVLNYMVTSNHVHLLVRDRGESEVSKSIQLVAGRTAQEYNERKGRKGAFWEDRYHATAVDTEEHLARCLVYIDLNMVRAGVVTDPQHWPASGYRETLHPPKRYRIVDVSALAELLGVGHGTSVGQVRAQWVAEAVRDGCQAREGIWSESLAVGSKAFVEGVKERLGVGGHYRQVQGRNVAYCLNEPEIAYSEHFGPKMGTLSDENTYSEH